MLRSTQNGLDALNAFEFTRGKGFTSQSVHEFHAIVISAIHGLLDEFAAISDLASEGHRRRFADVVGTVQRMPNEQLAELATIINGLLISNVSAVPHVSTPPEFASVRS